MIYPFFQSRSLVIFCLLICCAGNNAWAQGIRKHYTQVNEVERQAYVAALDNLIGSGVLEYFASVHGDPDQDGVDGNNFAGPDFDSQIHRVLIFLPWHRQFTAEFEQELQAINPKLSIPYWDWTGDLDPTGVNSRSAQSPLWDDDQIASLGWSDSFLGKYETSLNLDRDLSGILPTSNAKQNLLNAPIFDSFGNFRFELENDLHDPPHGWVGGEMQDMLFSPRDPIFYFHHATVDWLWQLWTEDGGSFDFSETDMPTFDGTVPGFSSVDPDDISNTVSDMGIFYADPSMSNIKLHSYTVNNNHVSNENFIYPDSIIVEPSFQFGNGAVAEVHSCEAVVLKPGVTIPNGTNVTIGTDAFCSGGVVAPKFADLPEEIEQETAPVRESVTLKGFPNPFRQTFTFQFNLPRRATVSMVLMDALGRVVATPLPSQQRESGQHELLVDTKGLANGIYSAVLLLHDSNQRYVLRVVKGE